MNLRFKLFLILVLYGTLACGQKVSNFQINGELFKIPGKWEFKTQRKESGQFLLSNKKEKLTLSISVRKPEKFEFFQEGLNESQLLDKFYRWEYDYWNSPNGIKAEISELKKDEIQNYIIWKIIIKNMPENENKDKPVYLLYAVRNNNLIAFQLSNHNEKKILLSESESIGLLEKVYLNN